MRNDDHPKILDSRNRLMTMTSNIEDIANETMPQEDIEIFESMKGHYVSDNEKTFFENMQRKEEEEWTTQGDLILSEKDNNLKLFLMRICYNEYQFGRPNGHDPKGRPLTEGFYAMSLSEVLSKNLRDVHATDYDITFWQWLRERDYTGIRYDISYD